jgi:hypothetical protein
MSCRRGVLADGDTWLFLSAAKSPETTNQIRVFPRPIQKLWKKPQVNAEVYNDEWQRK